MAEDLKELMTAFLSFCREWPVIVLSQRTANVRLKRIWSWTNFIIY